MLYAMEQPPFVLTYSSVALAYLPRPDGKVLTMSPDQAGLFGRFAKVPLIIGDQEDEGTLFALFQSNITTKRQVVDYLSDYYFAHASQDLLERLVSYYDDIVERGSPFRTGTESNWYPQFKRLAAILGDIAFTISRRAALLVSKGIAPDIQGMDVSVVV